MNTNTVVNLLQSEKFKRILLGIGFLALVSTAFIAIDPGPFLQFGYPGIFVFNLVGGPGLILVPILVKNYNPYLIALASAFGMAFNDSLSWYIGSYGHKKIPHSPRVQKIEESISRYGVVALFFWSLIPFPYDLIGLISGYLGLSYKRFLVPTFLGKFIRFVLVAYGFLKLLG